MTDNDDFFMSLVGSMASGEVFVEQSQTEDALDSATQHNADLIEENARLRAELEQARAAQTQAERERDEARADVSTLARSYLKPYTRVLKQDAGDGGFHATIIEFPGCYSEGETRDEALTNVQDAAIGWMLAALSMGQTIPEPMRYRRTIRALVVAARAINCTLAEEMARDLSLIDLLGKDGPARLAERRKNRTARIKSNYWPMPECLKRDMDRNLRARGVDLDTFHAKITAITSKPPQAKE